MPDWVALPFTTILYSIASDSLKIAGASACLKRMTAEKDGCPETTSPKTVKIHSSTSRIWTDPKAVLSDVKHIDLQLSTEYMQERSRRASQEGLEGDECGVR